MSIYSRPFYKNEKKNEFLRYEIYSKKINPPCTITRPEIYPEFKIHLSTLTRGLNAHKYGMCIFNITNEAGKYAFSVKESF